MCFIPGADPVSGGAISILQARDASKKIEHQNRTIFAQQQKTIRDAEKATVQTTGVKTPRWNLPSR